MLAGQSKWGADKFDQQDKAIDAFRRFATNRNIHITLVIHPRKETDPNKLSVSSIFGTAKSTQEADSVVIIRTYCLVPLRSPVFPTGLAIPLPPRTYSYAGPRAAPRAKQRAGSKESWR